MRKKGLDISRPKTHSVLFNPKLIPDGIFRRKGKTTFPNTKKRLSEQYIQMAKHDQVVLDFDPFSEDLQQLHELRDFWFYYKSFD